MTFAPRAGRAVGTLVLASVLLPAISNGQNVSFNVASVKVLGPDVPRVPLYSGGPGSSDPGRLHLRLTMSALLTAAFGAYADQIEGPPWLRDYAAMPFYDLIATIPPASDKEEVQKMLQNLLVERFHLRFHLRTALFPAYELLVDRAGSKLKMTSPSSGAADEGLKTKTAATGADGFPVVSGSHMMGFRANAAHQRIKFQEWSMNSLAVQLGFLLGRSEGHSVDDGSYQPRVVNKTELDGAYTFILEYDCAACTPLRAPSAAVVEGPETQAAANSEPGGFPDLAGALQKELGLRLVKTADLPQEVVIVDQIDKLPTAN